MKTTSCKEQLKGPKELSIENKRPGRAMVFHCVKSDMEERLLFALVAMKDTVQTNMRKTY